MTNVFDLMNNILILADQLQFLFWALAVVLFLWGLVKFMKNAADTEAHEEGKNLMIWGIISFFVLVTLWGIVTFLLRSADVTPIDELNFINKSGVPVR